MSPEFPLDKQPFFAESHKKRNSVPAFLVPGDMSRLGPN